MESWNYPLHKCQVEERNIKGSFNVHHTTFFKKGYHIPYVYPSTALKSHYLWTCKIIITKLSFKFEIYFTFINWNNNFNWTAEITTGVTSPFPCIESLQWMNSPLLISFHSDNSCWSLWSSSLRHYLLQRKNPRDILIAKWL